MLKYRLALIILLAGIHVKGQDIGICARGGNDIISILKENGYRCRLYEDPASAVNGAPRGSGLLFLAGDYPAQKVMLPDSIFRLARSRQLRIYIEYPGHIPGMTVNDTVIRTQLERGVVTTREIGGLDSLQLLGIHNSAVIPLKAARSLIVLGKVAGFDKAIFGIDDVVTYPLLLQQDNLLVAATRLSNCLTSRFEPVDPWKKVWHYILHWLNPGVNWRFSRWPLQVHPAYGPAEKLPPGALRKAIADGSDWFYNAKFFVHPSWERLFLQRTGDGSDVVGPPVSADLPCGNGSLGVMEGHVSRIRTDGSQSYRWWNRADDQAGVAYALAATGKFLNRPEFLHTSGNLMEYLFVRSNLRAGPRNDPGSPSFGLIGWGTTHPFVYYGDDNARTILGAIGTAAGLHSDKWDDYIIEAITGNFRTAGKNGFRGSSLDEKSLQEKGWRYFGKRDLINVHPHFESWLWACYIWLYDKTGYKPLLDKAETAIRISMDSFPNWNWTNGIQQERARMILPLAWLVRVSDTKEHRLWLKEVADELLADLQPCGAIREELGDERYGKYGQVRSNKEYGSGEAPLIAKNGNPAADLLYTENFAFFAMNEAALATGDPVYREAVNRMADFLVRIQVASRVHRDLNGAWFRAFDYRQWDYWASNADAGWGSWCTQTGWTQTWILSTLILMQKQSSFWEETRHMDIKKQAVPILHEMLHEK